MTRREILAAALLPFLPARTRAAPFVSVLIGSGAPGHSDTQVNNPYGVAFGPDGALYFCDLDNQLQRSIRRPPAVLGDVAPTYAGPL